MTRQQITNSLNTLLIAVAAFTVNPVLADSLLDGNLLDSPFQVITAQEGNSNSIELAHYGNDLHSNIEQIGSNNTVSLHNRGNDNSVQVSQKGNDNTAVFKLENNAQRITVQQQGNGMSFSVYQY